MLVKLKAHFKAANSCQILVKSALFFTPTKLVENRPDSVWRIWFFKSVTPAAYQHTRKIIRNSVLQEKAIMCHISRESA